MLNDDGWEINVQLMADSATNQTLNMLLSWQQRDPKATKRVTDAIKEALEIQKRRIKQ
jgi:hypothetical protein